MEKHILLIFSLVVLVAFSGLLNYTFLDGSNKIQGALIIQTRDNNNPAKQQGALVMVGQTKQKIPEGQDIKKSPAKKIEPTKKTTTGLIIKDGMPYTVMTGMGTTMTGMVQVKGITLSINTLKEHGIKLENGKLKTPNKKDVQIKDAALRRKPIKLTFDK